MRARLWTWWHECDSDNDTQESPATILIFFVMQWLGQGEDGEDGQMGSESAKKDLLFSFHHQIA